MFATRYFCARYFAPRYFPKVGAEIVAAIVQGLGQPYSLIMSGM
jgi:hypothetical protein